MGMPRLVDTDDDGTNLTGTPHNNAWLQALQDNIDANITDWAAIPFSAGNFTASAGTWTVSSGNVLLNMKRVINKSLHWHLYLQFSSVSASPANLRIAIPIGAFDSGVVLVQGARLWLGVDNIVSREMVAVPGDTTHLYIRRADGGVFNPSASLTSVAFCGEFKLS